MAEVVVRSFTLDTPDRVVFGPGTEASAGETLIALGAERVLLVCLASHREGADRVAAALGDRAVGVFDGAVQHVPRPVADAAVAMARQQGADWVLAHGGGTAVGVAKAIALSCDVRVAAIPTTYSGSERTDIWGLTDEGAKVTGRDARVRPRLVLYDPELTLGLRRDDSLRSLLNALAHSVEALYAEQATAEARRAAEDSLAPLLAGLKGIGADPADLEARAEALYGAWLAAEALNGATMALHHKLAHVLGGSFGTRHADTHATLLPYTMAFNLGAAPRAREALQRAWSTDDPAAHLYDQMRDLGLSVDLKDLGLDRSDLPRIAALATAGRYPNPRPFEAADLHRMLLDAWHARRPTADHGRVQLGQTGAHGGLKAATAGPPLSQAHGVVIAVHGRGSNADRFLADLRRRAGTPDGIAWIAPQAAGNSWYPNGFLEPIATNQPHFDGALAAVQAAWDRARAHVPAERIAVVGFSQGACLLLSWLLSDNARPGRVLAMSGAPSPVAGDFSNLAGVPVHLGVSLEDPWVANEAWREAVASLREAGAAVDARTRPGSEHGVHPFDDVALCEALDAIAGDGLTYQTGFGDHLRSEAIAGALPARGNTPQHAPFGLIAEQINGTGFTFERHLNHRVWLYRLRPAIHHRGFEALDPAPPHFAVGLDTAVPFPEACRFRPIALPDAGVDWLDGVQTFAAAGDPALGQGIAVHLYAATADMRRVVCNVDGDLLVAPEHGRLRVQTELGWLAARPGEILILPRGIRFRVELPDGASRGFVAELYDGHFRLPERGLVGANGLADERHFRAPVAAFEDRPVDTEIVVKQGGRFWRTVAPHAPFDVVAWHGTYAPFVYDLADFASLGSVNHDHPDPSILTVLTCPLDDHGRNAIDVGVFRGRWDATERTFRPPYFHRNAATEFNAVIAAPPGDGPYPPGAFSYTPLLTPHGVSAASQRRELERTDDAPHRIPDTSLWLQFESAYALGILPRWLAPGVRDDTFLGGFQAWRLGGLTEG